MPGSSDAETVDYLAKLLARRIERFQRSEDQNLLLEGEAIRQARSLSDLVSTAKRAGARPHKAAYLMLGLFHWLRSRILPQGQCDDDQAAALEFFAEIYPFAAELMPDEIRESLAYAVSAMDQLAEFRQSGDLDSLNTSIEMLTRVADGASGVNPDHDGVLSELAGMLQDRFWLTGHAEDLDNAIRLLQQATDGMTADHPFRELLLSNLAGALENRYQQTGDIADLEAAIRAGFRAVEAAGPDPGLATLTNLGNALHARSRRFGNAADLQTAMNLLQQAIDASLPGDPDRAHALTGLGNAMLTEFGRTGLTAELDAAIGLLSRAVEVTPADHPARARRLSNLAGVLRASYEQTAQVTHLDAAVTAGRQAVQAVPAGHAQRPAMLTNLGGALLARHQQTRLVQDLDEAIKRLSEAAEECPADHAGRPAMLTNLGTALLSRYERTRQSADLDNAIAAGRSALDATPVTHPDRPAMLTLLGNASKKLFDSTGQAADLDSAITLLDEAVKATTVDDPGRAGRLFNLGRAMLNRHGSTRQAADLRAAIDCWHEAANAATAPPGIRVLAARQWADCAFGEGDIRSAAEGFDVAIRLLPEATWTGLDKASQQQQIERWPGLAADAAACSLAANNARRAVELLDQGRSVLWTQTLHLRTDLTRLHEMAPDLASGLEQARSALDRPTPAVALGIDSPPQPWNEEIRKRRAAARDWAGLLYQVRKLPSFENFLADVPFAELSGAASMGPVIVINVSRLGCHGVVVSSGPPNVEVVALPDLSYQEVAQQANLLLAILKPHNTAVQPSQETERSQALFNVLDWLWQAIAAPMLDAVGYTAPPDEGTVTPRVWWCPTGPLTVLPLHAAGHHSRTPGRATPPSDLVHGRVISSYVATLASLKRACRTEIAGRERPSQLAVAMPTTPGMPPLPGASEELAILAKYFAPPRESRQLAGENATRATVMRELADYPWVHFACHAQQDQSDPAQAAFFLNDGPLSLHDLSALHINNGELAFLSACETATANVRLLDEAMNLAGAMQVLGYKHVIATLWTIYDRPAATVADMVYSRLTRAGFPDSSRAAEALHRAVEQLRESHPGNPLLWAPYIHLGP